MHSAETIARLAYFREKAQTPAGLTTEEQKEAIRLIREDRVSAGYASAAAKAKKPSTAADGAAVLGKLQALFKAEPADTATDDEQAE